MFFCDKLELTSDSFKLVLSHALYWQVKELKSKLQKAVKKGMQVLANDTKESLKKYEQELLTAKIEKEKHEQNLQNLTKEIEKVSEELKSMGIEEQDTLESLCKRIIYLLCFSLFLPICFLLLVFFHIFKYGKTEFKELLLKESSEKVVIFWRGEIVHIRWGCCFRAIWGKMGGNANPN